MVFVGVGWWLKKDEPKKEGLGDKTDGDAKAMVTVMLRRWR